MHTEKARVEIQYLQAGEQIAGKNSIRRIFGAETNFDFEWDQFHMLYIETNCAYAKL